MKPYSKLLCLLILLSASAYAKEELNNSAEQITTKINLAQNNNDCKQIHNNQTNEIVMMCRDEEGQYQIVDQNNVDDKIDETTPSDLTENEIADKKTEYISLKQEWQSKLPIASGNDLMMIYTRLIELAPYVGEQQMVKQYIRDMAFAWVRDGTQPGQECGFLKAVYEELGAEALNNHTKPNAKQADILEIEFPYAKACFNAGQTVKSYKLLDTAFNRVNKGTKLKNPDQINGMIKLASEVTDKLGQIDRKEEASTLSESVALVYYKNGYSLKAADWLIKAGDANDKTEKKEFLYKKAIEVIPKNEEYGNIEVRKNLADYYIQSERYDDALLISQSIEAIANTSKDKEIKGFGYCKAGHVINAYNDLYEKSYLDSKTTKGMPKKNLELKRKATFLLEKGWNFAKDEKNQSWTAKCEYSLSYALFNDYGPQHKLDDKRIFDLRLESGERFAQLNMNELAKSAFISSSYTALIYGYSYFGFKNPEDDKNKQGYQLGCQTYYRGVQLGLYRPEDEDVKSLIIPVCYKNGSRKY